MIKKLAKNIARFFVTKEYINPFEINSYQYGFEILLSTLFSIIPVLVLSLFFHSLLGALLYLASFILMRTTCGGYHAKKQSTCMLIFLSIFVIFSIGIRFLSNNIIAIYNMICTIISSLIIWKVAPVEASNKPLSYKTRRRNEKLCLAVGCIFMALSLTLYITITTPIIETAYLFSGELAAALSMIAGSIKQKEG